MRGFVGLGALVVVVSMMVGGVANAQPKCKPPQVLHNGSCVHPDDIKEPEPQPKPTPSPVPKPPPVVKPPPPAPPPPPEPEPEPEVKPDPAPEPEPDILTDPIPDPDPVPDPQSDDGHEGGSDKGGSGVATGGYVLIGVGGAALVVGVITGAMVLARKSTVEDPAHCDPPDDNGEIFCDQEGQDAADEGKTLSAVSTATFVIGLAAIGTGIALAVMGSDDETQAKLEIGPGSLTLRGRF